MSADVGMTTNSFISEPTLADMLRHFWKAKYAIFLGGVLGLLLAGALLSQAVPKYKATMLIAPESLSGGGHVADILRTFVSFGGENFISLPEYNGNSDRVDFMRFEQIIRAPSIAQSLLSDVDLLANIRKDRDFRFLSPEKADSAQEVAAYLQDHVRIEPVGTTPMRRLVYLHEDPVFAVGLLEKLYAETDRKIREDMRKKTDQRIHYLQNELDKTIHPDHKKALTSLLMEQERSRMVLEIDQAFAAGVAEPASSSPKPAFPRKGLWLVVFMFSGAFFGYLMRELIRAVRG